MANYSIDDGHGNLITAGLQDEAHARRTAQSQADRRGESVYLYEVGCADDEFEEFSPAVISAAELQAASGCADVGGGNAVEDCDALYGRTIASKLEKLSSAADAVERANALCPESKRDQNWEMGATTYEFDDGSQLQICGKFVKELHEDGRIEI